jgi:hypothetical protein
VCFKYIKLISKFDKMNSKLLKFSKNEHGKAQNISNYTNNKNSKHKTWLNFIQILYDCY